MIPEPRDGSVVLSPMNNSRHPIAFQRRDEWDEEGENHEPSGYRWFAVGMDMEMRWSDLKDPALIHEGKPV